MTAASDAAPAAPAADGEKKSRSLEKCRGKKIGDSSCKFDVCQKLPSFDGKKAPRRDKRPPRDAVAGASGASESKREA
jgi:hypothetical protein